jgi:SAM-dependent methyltransferase
VAQLVSEDDPNMRLIAVSASVFALCGLAAAQDFGASGDVPFVPTRPQVVEEMLKMAQVKKGDTVYDLGCGDGRIVIMAAQKFGAHAVGVDIDPQRVKEATENAKKAGVSDRVRFIQGNLFDADIHRATVVTLYLLPDVNVRLRPKLLKDLAPGTRVVSHSFTMGDWKADKETDADGTRLYLWTIPAGGTLKQ